VDVEYFDGSDPDDVGYPYYVAHSPELRFTTDGRTFDELFENIQECLRLCLDDADSVAEYGVIPEAHVQLTMEVIRPHAKTA
jgi:predicted RNase H-like HicB family nuclease